MTSAPKRNESSSPKSVKGVKTLMATVSLAATVGGWALLSANQNPATKAATASTRTAPSIAPTTMRKPDLPVLPTLVPPPSARASFPTQPVAPTMVLQPTGQPQPTLRAVNQPPPQRIVHVGGGDGGSNDSSAPAPAAQTSSSR